MPVIKWLKALLPISVLALSLFLIFMAFQQAAGPDPAIQPDGAAVPGCFGDRDCQREYGQERSRRGR